MGLARSGSFLQAGFVNRPLLPSTNYRQVPYIMFKLHSARQVQLTQGSSPPALKTAQTSRGAIYKVVRYPLILSVEDLSNCGAGGGRTVAPHPSNHLNT